MVIIQEEEIKRGTPTPRHLGCATSLKEFLRTHLGWFTSQRHRYNHRHAAKNPIYHYTHAHTRFSVLWTCMHFKWRRWNLHSAQECLIIKQTRGCYHFQLHVRHEHDTLLDSTVSLGSCVSLLTLHRMSPQSPSGAWGEVFMNTKNSFPLLIKQAPRAVVCASLRCY